MYYYSKRVLLPLLLSDMVTATVWLVGEQEVAVVPEHPGAASPHAAGRQVGVMEDRQLDRQAAPHTGRITVQVQRPDWST